MDDHMAAVARLGGTTPTSFPHRCFFQPNGATNENCADWNGQFPRNRDGCCVIKCNSVIRKCFFCLEEGKRGRNAKTVTNVDLGCCDDHKKALEMEQRRLTPVHDIRGKRPVPVVSGTADNSEAGQEKKPMTILTEAEYKSVEKLDSEELFVIEKASYGYALPWIDDNLKTLENRTSQRSVYDIFRAIYKKFELSDVGRDDKMQHTAKKRYVAYRDMKLQALESVTLSGSQSAPEPREEQLARAEEADTVEVPGDSEAVAPPECDDKCPEERPARSKPARKVRTGEVDEELVESVLARIPNLTVRQLKILKYCSEGLTNAEIAQALPATSEQAIQVAFTPIYATLGLKKVNKQVKRAVAEEACKRHFAALAASSTPATPPAAEPVEPTQSPNVPPESGAEDDVPAMDVAEATRPPDRHNVAVPEVASAPVPTADLEALEMHLNDVIDSAEATLKTLGLKRRKRSESQ